MTLERIVLTNFRCYESLELEFGDNANLILGDNGSGKTNLAEAIYFLSLARSWRTSEERSLIRQGCESASIRAFVREGNLNREILVELTPQGKRLFLNGKPLNRVSQLSRLVNVLLFTPEDVGLFAGPPSERRSFLDTGLSKRSGDYLSLVLKAAALLKGRNAALKEKEPDRNLVEVLTEQLIAVQEPIVRYRTMYVASLNGVLPEVYSTLRGEKTDCTLVYRSFVRDDGAFPENARKAYRDALEGDILRHSTSVGIHREDFSFRLNGRDVAEFGSQGENRLAALSLKLSPFFLIEEAEKKPICVLDDVTSELDAQNAGRLLDYLKQFGQSFLTATDLTLEGASVIEVANHSAKRRN